MTHSTAGAFGKNYRYRTWHEVEVGERLPEIRMPISYRRVVQMTVATRDFFPGHHNREYARNQGVEDIYLNTMTYHGLIDRYVLEWAGPEAFLRKRSMRMGTSITAGDEVVMNGQVTAKEREGEQGVVVIEMVVANRAGLPCCPATVRLWMPDQ